MNNKGSHPFLSVVIPTHDPQREFLSRTVEALKQQSLPYASWELVIVDNASATPVSSWIDLSWHPQARVVIEDRLGLTPARVCGYKETTGDYIVMVDDDNLLSRDYLETSKDIATSHPRLGTFGGSIEPAFQSPPPAWTKPHWAAIAIRPCTRSVWSNDIDHWESCPSGAGMCVQRSVFAKYVEQISSDPVRLALDRQGTSLMSGGDLDLVFTGLSMGMGMGRFRELCLEHLIPPGRLEADYLLNIYRAKGFSGRVLSAVWNRPQAGAGNSGLSGLLRLGAAAVIRELRSRKFYRAQRAGIRQAEEYLDALPRTD